MFVTSVRTNGVVWTYSWLITGDFLPQIKFTFYQEYFNKIERDYSYH